ncbi:MAG: TIGR04053 family radical SAM/SPASM domain-containing protein [Elusimicrobia bacterium]|nr:TIGR04053 family radical SAM/SPASM domain-containing protein [Elusimicrobiota bacterium]
MKAPSGMPKATDFSEAPFLVIWETTRACALACKHCRAEAWMQRDPRELSTEEGKELIGHVADMGTPIFILSGGDPLNREDLEELVRHGKSRRLRMGTIPAATPSLNRERLRVLKAAGLDQVAFSLDAPKPDLHDGFRGTPGAFQKTLEAASWARELDLPLQINTCLASWNYPFLEEMISLVKGLGVVFWEVFFLIPVGRGSGMQGLTPQQFEGVFDRLHRLNDEEEFVIKLTEAQHYRRFVIQRELSSGDPASRERIRRILARPRGVRGSIGQSPHTVNSGKGFLFIDHVGNICPSGFLPFVAGNVRNDNVAAVYRRHPTFRQLRDPAILKGKCGLCRFSAVCGGSRARAWAETGDYLAEDPSCVYRP